MDTTTQIRDIKQDLRGMMNGPVSASLRQKGLAYKLIFGVELPRLRQYAATLQASAGLAAALWKEDVRECRLLACMLMPPEQFDADLAGVWLEQIRFPEEADNVVFHLLSKVPYASELAFRALADERRLYRYTAYQLLARFFAERRTPTRRDMMEFLDQAAVDLNYDDRLLFLAAHKALIRFSELGIGHHRLADHVFRKAGLDD